MNQFNLRLRNLYYKIYATKQIISTLILVWEQEINTGPDIFVVGRITSSASVSQAIEK